MNPDGKKLLELMFREGETVCVSPNQYAYHALSLDDVAKDEIPLVSNNASIPTRFCASKDLILVALNPVKGHRCDANAYKYRNFLIEMDDGTLPEQIAYINKLGIPYSGMVFSGGKSIHTLIALDKGVPSEKTYRFIAEWILQIATLADPNIKNPTRCIRIPGAIRDNGKKQRLYSMGERVKLEDLMAWLNKFPNLMPKQKEKKKVSTNRSFDNLSPWALQQITEGINFKKGRNAGWFALAVDFAYAGWSEDATIDFLLQKFNEDYDFREKEFVSAIRKGFKHALDGKK